MSADALSDYVKFFRDTSPYINAHRGKTVVIALSGEAIEHANAADIVHDIALLNTLGVKLVLVHGARPQLAARLRARAIDDHFSRRTRVTDPVTMACVKDAVGSTRISLEALLSMGLANSPMHGARIRTASGNFITARPLGVRDGVDFQLSGEVRRVDRRGIEQQLAQGSVVLVSPLGYSPTGEAFNLDSEALAAQVAIALAAEKLVLYCRDDGVVDRRGDLKKMLTLAELAQLQTALEPAAELYPALSSACQAGQQGVPRSHLISYRRAGALLQELFTREGAGTLILKESRETIREASIDDVAGILELIEPLEQAGVLVKRSRELLEREISRFNVMVHPEGVLVACAALYPLGDDAGELACVVSHPDYRAQGLAQQMLAAVERQARQQQLQQLFVLTTQTAHWFAEQGFVDTTIEQLPSGRQSLYNLQRNSKVLVKTL